MKTTLITTAEAALVLGLVPDSVRRLARTRKLRTAVLTASGLRLFDLQDVQRLADGRRAARETVRREQRRQGVQR